MALGAKVGFIGQIPVLGPIEPEDRNDFRDVPGTDKGNASYSDRGMLGSYTPDSEPYGAPRGVRFAAGYGADMADLDRGYCRPGISEDPAYDKVNYSQRSSQPRVPDEDQGNAEVMGQDWEFRNRNARSRGFLTRPRLPTER